MPLHITMQFQYNIHINWQFFQIIQWQFWCSVQPQNLIQWQIFRTEILIQKGDHPKKSIKKHPPNAVLEFQAFIKDIKKGVLKLIIVECKTTHIIQTCFVSLLDCNLSRQVRWDRPRVWSDQNGNPYRENGEDHPFFMGK